jgi:hypothetical protein
MDTIPAVENSPPQINSAEFVRITIYNDYEVPEDTTVLTASSAYKDETIDSQVFSAVGGLMSIGGQQKSIRVTSADTTVALSGIQGTLINTVLSTKIRGSELEIWRGFYNTSGELTSTAKRFTGIITSYNITEDRAGLDDSFVVSVNASSYKTVLANRIAGRKTNKQSWQFFNTDDSSMNNVYSIAQQTFDFGKEVTATGGNRGGGGRRDDDGGRNEQQR